MTIGGALARRDNALNFIRLLLAAGVIVGHSYQLSNIPAPSLWLNPRLQDWCLNGFFCVSGYLIAGSRTRLSFGTFIERRARRLLPGLWAVLVVVAFGFAPVVAALSGEHWSPTSAVAYVLDNFYLPAGQGYIADTLTRAPNTPIWNGPLWTLAYEAGCYIAFGLLLSARGVRRHGGLICGALLIALCALHPFIILNEEVPALWHNTVRLGSYFTAGVLCWFLRDRIPSRWWMVVTCAVAILVLSLVSDGQWYGQLPAAVGLLTVGGLLPIRIGATNDISYGIYIYGWPVQQALVNLGATAWGIFVYQALALVLVIPFAWASWVLVERRWLPRAAPSQAVPITLGQHHP
ncbi:acyltransferase [Nocardioides KLBMP 9356]|uniref:Acyltransferase n=1 Tax=Nocardioides potassii TaxID=2911371 RepID=A0ABS9H4V0_9ACTN|nr:acyltransferase [Nocardioides potassii]MCF6376285.1 acyltransferase [Nocardioides potassii]